ncbi:MAG: hypothetical protein Q8L48_38460 [Archangium sp.]|nr:hypothetical protein [Archangium sp.]
MSEFDAKSVTLRALLDQGQARGLTTLPPFIAVSLVHRLCRALQEPLERTPGEASLENVRVGFDGSVQVPVSAGAGRDVAAAALILDQLLGETIDAELTRLIGEARRSDPGITTPLALEQRLGHWQVKQRQLFPKHELVSALVAWLFPESEGAPDEAVAAWFTEQCTWPLAPGRLARAVVPTPRGTSAWPWRLALGAGALLGAGLVLVELPALFDEPAPPPAMIAPRPPAPPPPAAAPRPPTVDAPPPAPPTLPRWAEGAPAQVRLSSVVHGVLLETAGFSVTAPGRPWAARTRSRQLPHPPPRYASLFVAEFDAQHAFKRLALVGPKSWLALSEPEARFFVIKTDHAPDDGSFALRLAGPGAKGEQLRPEVLNEAMTDVEYRRFVLEGLSPTMQYAVTQASGPPVVVTATVPKAAVRDLTGAGIQQPGTPPDQLLLQVGAPVKVKGVSRLSFVVLTTRDAPEVFASLFVKPLGAVPVPKPTAPTLSSYEQCRQFAPDPAQCEDLRPAAPKRKTR